MTSTQRIALLNPMCATAVALLLHGSALAQMPLAPAAPQPSAPTQPTPLAQTAAARAALARLGVDVRHVQLAIAPTTASQYRVAIAHDHIRAQGSSPVALVHGVAQVLGRQGKLAVSWEGRRAAALVGLAPMDTGNVVSPFGVRAYLNPCTYGYTTPFWGWAQWQAEIDQMAAQGIDTPLALEGQEYVWAKLWREAGLSEAEIGEGLSAAPFLPWQRMGNIAGYRAPLSPGWIEKKHQLQRQILTRMRALGMKPVLPAFAGYVPKGFALAHPKARIYKMRSWEGFEGT